MGLGVGKRTILPTVPMIFAASMGPGPKISVSEASRRRGRRAAAPPGAVCRAGCVRLGGRRASRPP